MKEIVGFFAASIVMMVALCVHADTYTTNGVEWTYAVSNGEVTITDVPESVSGNIEVPSTLNGYPVTSIAAYSFKNCNRISALTIPQSVTNIGDYAFYYCDSLMSVTIPDSVTSIGNYAFSGCSSLTSVTIPDSITSIGRYAFSDCSSLESVRIPNSVTWIGYKAFEGCKALKKVYIFDIESFCATMFQYRNPVNVDKTSDSSNPLKYGASLYLNDILVTELVINDDCNKYRSLRPCGSITNITILATVTEINVSGFNSLISITIPNSITNIGESAFSDCSSLTSVTIPDSVTSIGNYAFSSLPSHRRDGFLS